MLHRLKSDDPRAPTLEGTDLKLTQIVRCKQCGHKWMRIHAGGTHFNDGGPASNCGSVDMGARTAHGSLLRNRRWKSAQQVLEELQRILKGIGGVLVYHVLVYVRQGSAAEP